MYFLHFESDTIMRKLYKYLKIKFMIAAALIIFFKKTLQFLSLFQHDKRHLVRKDKFISLHPIK